MLREICNNFLVNGSYKTFRQVCGGNINKTYKVFFTGKNNCYILQKINTLVFNNPTKLMENQKAIINHLNSLGKNYLLTPLKFVKTKSGEDYFIDSQGNFWRMYEFINNSISYSSSDNQNVIFEAGYAYGSFLNALSNFDISRLHIAIKDFHNTPLRLASLKQSINNSPRGKVNLVKDEIDFLLTNEGIASYYISKIEKGQLKLKVTHNDTKFNNVLFSKTTHKALAVIDLDTVMPGLISYDFGDATRSICSQFGEDFNGSNYFMLDKFKAFSSGFLKAIKGSLSLYEYETLYFAPIVMTYELACRFLKDYLDGNIYFKCDFTEHNLVRAKNQISLLQDLLNKRQKLQQIIYDIK